MFQGITFPFSHIVHHKSIPIPLTSLLITQLTFLLVSKALRSALLFYRWIRMPSLPFIVVYFTISLHSCHFHFKKFYRRQFDFHVFFFRPFWWNARAPRYFSEKCKLRAYTALITFPATIIFNAHWERNCRGQGEKKHKNSHQLIEIMK